MGYRIAALNNPLPGVPGQASLTLQNEAGTTISIGGLPVVGGDPRESELRAKLAEEARRVLTEAAQTLTPT